MSDEREAEPVAAESPSVREAFEWNYFNRYGFKPPYAPRNKNPQTGQWEEPKEPYCNNALHEWRGWQAAWYTRATSADMQKVRERIEGLKDRELIFESDYPALAARQQIHNAAIDKVLALLTQPNKEKADE